MPPFYRNEQREPSHAIAAMAIRTPRAISRLHCVIRVLLLQRHDTQGVKQSLQYSGGAERIESSGTKERGAGNVQQRWNFRPAGRPSRVLIPDFAQVSSRYEFPPCPAVS